MANEDILQEDEEEYLVLEGENGEELKYDYMDCVEYEGTEYLIVTPYIENEEDEADEESVDPIELVFLEIEPVDEEYENYHLVSDQKVLNAIYAILKERYKGKFTFMD